MTDDAQLEAQIRARDACWNDGKQWNGSVQYAIKINSSQLYLDGQSTMVGDRRTLLRLLDEARVKRASANDLFQFQIGNKRDECEVLRTERDEARIEAETMTQANNTLNRMLTALAKERDEARNTSILVKAQAEGCASLLLDVQQTCIAVAKERDKARLQRDEESHQFQNFHRLLCERFGYGHDPVDWRRDQLSLIEHIAARLTTPSETP